jgi:fused signal recognition particle receptor
MFSFFSKNKISQNFGKISGAISQIFTHKKLNEETLEELEETLILNDLGVESASQIIENLRAKKFDKNISQNEVKDFLRSEIIKIIQPCQKTLETSNQTPQVIIFNGVNGAGKTTTIGKIALNLKNQNKKVLIAACDTFRAAAAAQLEIWSKRANCEIFLPQKEGEDPAALAFRALSHAKENKFDILLIDTAGRLQNKEGLMEELKKINRVLKKIDENAPQENILILDATTGQNAHNQLKIFNQAVNITGLIITKLDGSSKAGVVVALCKNFQKPIYAIGVGEKIDDLQEFSAQNFAQNLIN